MTNQCYACGQEISFSPQFLSENGIPIPLGLDGLPHSCPRKNQKWKNSRNNNNNNNISSSSRKQSSSIVGQSDYHYSADDDDDDEKPTRTRAIEWSGDRLFREILHVYDRLNGLEVRIEALERELFVYLQRHKQQQQSEGGAP
jgi:hypothetical protein